MVFDNIEATFEFDPCTNCLVTPRLPVQDVTRQQYEILILDPIPKFKKNVKPCKPFQLNKSS